MQHPLRVSGSSAQGDNREDTIAAAVTWHVTHSVTHNHYMVSTGPHTTECHRATHSETIPLVLTQGEAVSVTHRAPKVLNTPSHRLTHTQFQAGSGLHCLMSSRTLKISTFDEMTSFLRFALKYFSKRAYKMGENICESYV